MSNKPTLTHSERCYQESTRDVIFLFQHRRLMLTGYIPKGYAIEDGELVKEQTGSDGEPELACIDDLYDEHGSEFAFEVWHTEGVWIDRAEAEEWGESHSYRFGRGRKGKDWRVYGVPSYGDLAAILRGDLTAQNDRLRDRITCLRNALDAYATCSDGCTCGDGWSHDAAKEALEMDDLEAAKETT